MSKHARSAAALPVDGVQWQTRDGWTFPARSPASGEVLWQLPDAGIPEADAAAHAAWRAFHETPWSTDTTLRTDTIGRLREALAARSDDLALMLATETGVPVALRAAHLDAPIAGMWADSQQEPPGVTVVITPATSPLAVAIEEVGRVLVAGGTVVLKPAPEAASAALELGRIALDILPRGVLNVVSTRDVDVAIALTLDHRVDEISFTGSAVSGDRVQAAGEQAGKRVRLDVGGPLTIRAADDHDLRAVVSAAAVTVAANAGQGSAPDQRGRSGPPLRRGAAHRRRGHGVRRGRRPAGARDPVRPAAVAGGARPGPALPRPGRLGGRRGRAGRPRPRP